MNCPICSTPMIHGAVFQKRHWPKTLLFGLLGPGNTDLWFKSEDGLRKSREVSGWDQPEAFKCDECDALLIADLDSN